jgi:hypothetical protein
MLEMMIFSSQIITIMKRLMRWKHKNLKEY